MWNRDSDPSAIYAWLPPLVLKFLVFLIFAFVLFEATVGLRDSDLPANRVWVMVAGNVTRD